MSEGKRHKGAIPPFTAILLLIALSVAGIASMPLLNIQYLPTAPNRELSVSYQYPYASAQVVEAQVTGLLEGVLSSLEGITDISSLSQKGSGKVTARFGKGKDMDAARFEAASAIRNIYPSLPEGVSFPEIRVATSGAPHAGIVYVLKGAMPSYEIEKYAREHLLAPLSSLEDVDGVILSGGLPFHWVITFDPQKAKSCGISASEIAEAFRNACSDEMLGMARTEEGGLSVRLSTSVGDDLGAIPIKKVGERIVYMRDLATWRYEEKLPDSYYRVNGLNTISLAVSTIPTANTLRALASVRHKMDELEACFPEGITAGAVYDASRFVQDELWKIYRRTLLCILILLLFVLAVSRNWRYVFVIGSTLAVNILSAIFIYAVSGIQIHLYTLAGITVSLGIIIDTSIVMADHYVRWKDRQVFPAIFSATVTTIGALLAVLLLPESERGNLTDFIWVIVINLLLSLLVAYFFVPSLLSFVPPKNTGTGKQMHLKRLAVLESWYGRYIEWGARHRVGIFLLCLMAFGIPVCLLPEAQKLGRAGRILSSSFGFFYQSLDRADFYRTPVRKQLVIRAGMPEGSSVNQLNDVVRQMESYLAGFDEIEVFTTTISDFDCASIVVDFKPEYANSPSLVRLKSMVTAMAVNFGGANWAVYGIDDNSFNNNVVTSIKGNHILLEGYNYEQLSTYAGLLAHYLSTKPHVKEPEVWSSAWDGRPALEWVLDYDFETLTMAGVNPYRYYEALSSLLYDRPVGRPTWGKEVSEVVLRSADAGTYDLWHILNAPLDVDSTKVTLSAVGQIEKKRSGNSIGKSNQSYQLVVGYDFTGNTILGKRCKEDAVRYMNDSVLPLGFKAEDGDSDWGLEQKKHYAWIILVIVGILFILLSMSLESVRWALSVLLLIPVSFVGVFLVFGLSGLSFDQGGYASFVMLCGLVVNAGIYLLTAYRHKGGWYVRTLRYKIVPISLTILSTVLGLPQEVFWYDFACGTISGLVFSALGLLLILPAFVLESVLK